MRAIDSMMSLTSSFSLAPGFGTLPKARLADSRWVEQPSSAQFHNCCRPLDVLGDAVTDMASRFGHTIGEQDNRTICITRGVNGRIKLRYS